MSITDHLIADYLKRNGYDDTLKTFTKQAKLNLLAHSVNYENLEDIVNDRINYLDNKESVLIPNPITVTPNKAGDFDASHLVVPEKHKSLGIDSLVVHISSTKFKINDQLKDVAFVSTSDKKLTIVDLSNGDIITQYTGIHQSVIKCNYGLQGTDKLLSCGMDGKIKLVKLISSDKFEVISEIQAHKRLLSDLRVFYQEDEIYIFSIGWDYQLKATKLSTLSDKFEEMSSFKLLTNATTLEVGTYQKLPIILLTRLDSTQLSYFTVISNKLVELTKISLNDAEFSTHGFTPMSIALSSSDLDQKDGYAIVATSHVPYMRLIKTKLPNFDELISNVNLLKSNEEQELSTPVARGYILGNFSTLCEQDKYSQPKIVISTTDPTVGWVSGDDGIIRGVELQNGHVISELKHHEQRIKCLVNHKLDDGHELIVSSAIDKKLIYWF